MSRAGVSAGILAIIAVGVYHIGYSSANAVRVVTGSANIVGTNTLAITLTASCVIVKVTALNIYDAGGNLLIKVVNVTGDGACVGAAP